MNKSNPKTKHRDVEDLTEAEWRAEVVRQLSEMWSTIREIRADLAERTPRDPLVDPKTGLADANKVVAAARRAGWALPAKGE